MPKIAYIEKNFTDKTKLTIVRAMEIIEEYEEQGFSLTLRQLYYQFVARDYIPNKQREYNRLGSIINDARLAGYIDWDAIEDRTRSLKGRAHWEHPSEVIESAASSYRIDRWENQPTYIEVWIEKDALTGIISRVCRELDIPYFSCRGYVSQSEMWKAGRRLGRRKYLYEKNEAVILHLGDHDPSGIDMTRDIELRLNDFAIAPEDRQMEDPYSWTDPEWADYNREHEWPVTVRRIALNMPQIRELNPPPNPAKVTDSRFEGYLQEYGAQSWELDALEPRYMENLIRETVNEYIVKDIWEEDEQREKNDRDVLEKISQHYDEVKDFVDNL